jgi:ABC-type sugar transport system substrate-binding protein
VATRVAAALIQREKNPVGMAGFDSESGPGMGQAIKEAGRVGQIIATCVDTGKQHLNLLKDGVPTACVGQNRSQSLPPCAALTEPPPTESWQTRPRAGLSSGKLT